jgi:hypothetical protein
VFISYRQFLSISISGDVRFDTYRSERKERDAPKLNKQEMNNILGPEIYIGFSYLIVSIGLHGMLLVVRRDNRKH